MYFERIAGALVTCALKKPYCNVINKVSKKALHESGNDEPDDDCYFDARSTPLDASGVAGHSCTIKKWNVLLFVRVFIRFVGNL
jgi:hypothetical protein